MIELFFDCSSPWTWLVLVAFALVLREAARLRARMLLAHALPPPGAAGGIQ